MMFFLKTSINALIIVISGSLLGQTRILCINAIASNYSNEEEEGIDTIHSLSEKKPVYCKLSKEYIIYSETEEDEEYVCEKITQEDITTHTHSLERYFNENGDNKILRVKGINPEFLEKYDNDIMHGYNTLTLFKEIQVDNNEEQIIKVQDEIGIQDKEAEERQNEEERFLMSSIEDTYKFHRKLPNDNGINTLMVVRVSGKDDEVTFSVAELSKHFFGGKDDKLNFASQIAACSYHKLQIIPGTGHPLIQNGVVDVKLSTKVEKKETNDLMNEAQNQLLTQHGLDLRKFNLLAFCMPSSATHYGNGYLAYAWQHGYRSVYKNEWCTSISTQMHEMGHSIGLGHSGVHGKNNYEDLSCYMGYATSASEYPRMCYNAAKLYQLGWYEDHNTIINPKKGVWIGKLIGVADYGQAFANEQYYTILLIEQPKKLHEHLYLTFNRNKGINSDSRMFQNQVTVIQGARYEQSLVLTALGSGEYHKIEDFNHSGKNLFIQVSSITMNDPNGIDYAQVQIGFQNCFVESNCETKDETKDYNEQEEEEQLITTEEEEQLITTCSYTPLSQCKSCEDDSECNDNDNTSESKKCTSPSICLSGFCKKTNVNPCNDNNESTIDVCSEKHGCMHKIQLVSFTSTINTGETIAIKAKGFNNRHFDWFVNNLKNGSEELGYITNNGRYTAPTQLVSNSIKTVRIRAYKKKDSSMYGILTLHIKRGNNRKPRKKRKRKKQT